MEEDFNEAITLCREAVSLCPQGPQGDQDQSTYLIVLAHALFDKYNLQGGIDDLDEAIALIRAALEI